MNDRSKMFAALVLLGGVALLIYGCPDNRRKGPRPNTTGGETVEVQETVVEGEMPEEEKEPSQDAPAEPSTEPPAPEAEQEAPSQEIPQEAPPQNPADAPSEPKSEQL